MSLLDEVATRLRSAGTDEVTVALAVAACRGPEELADAVADPTPQPVPVEEREADGTRPCRGAHLAAVEVAGFRGIGPGVTLDLGAGPGLTLVVGRNGSGKSSFAEAVEYALTGDNRRWSRRSRVWRDGWRNLHAEHGARVAARFTVAEPSGEVEVERAWKDDADLDQAELTVRGVDGADDLDSIGWAAALDLYRPFLPYSELGAMVDEGPTSLHDALSAVLGLDLLTAGAKALRDQRLGRQRSWKAAVDRAAELAEELAGVDDPRAGQAAALLRERTPDVEAVAELAGTERGGDDPGLATVRQLATVTGPDLDEVRRAADALDEAARHARGLAGTDAARDLELADLLAGARRFHAQHGDGDCPVCGAGDLDAEWADRTARLEGQLRASAGAARTADAALTGARRAVAALAVPAPPVLRRAGVGGIDATLAMDTFDALAAVADEPDDRERAVRLRKAAEAVNSALMDLRRRAAAALAERDDQWRPWAQRLAGWVEGARDARGETAPNDALRRAERALAEVLDGIRTERWMPIAAQAREIWDALRGDSNVAIDDVALTGSGTRRRVEVRVTVDGIEGAALGVMSQGELHALALALFLPRATLEDSPFRFLVIDDPVQSMDRDRVAGLGRILHQVAAHRQVVVFTHDDRLPDAIARQGLDARILEVTRSAGSLVQVAATGRAGLD